MTTVLLTGAAGKVGKHAVHALLREGLDIVATDIVSHGISPDLRFESCDLTDATAVDRLLARVNPDVIAHCAAVVAPIAYAQPEIAEAVNLGGTRHLIDATKRHAPDAFFAFVSSYAAFGPVCPSDPIRRASDESMPADNYGRQKLTAETWLVESGLRQCSLRLGAVMDMHDLMPKHPSYRSFMFMVPLDQPEHGVDVRDVARAIAAAAVKQPAGGLFLIGGDDSWKVQARTLREEMLGVMGLKLPPEKAYRNGLDPDKPDGWFYECWMDADESHRVLGFQTIGRAAFMDEMRKANRLKKVGLSILSPFISRGMQMLSPYVGTGAITPGKTILDDLCSVYDMPTNTV